ncbi:MAG: helix-turn-helix domain-containing protein [Pseudobdellovibrionaceae bacterium]
MDVAKSGQSQKEQIDYNYYDILEVQSTAPQHEVHRAYERAKSTYSSENPALYTVFSPSEAKQLLMLVEEAYSIIGNTQTRNAYNQKLGMPLIVVPEVGMEGQVTKSVLPKVTLDLRKKQSLKLTYKQNSKMEEEIQNCEHCDGEFLKRVREYKDLTLERLSEIIKVSAYYLRAVEEMNAANLPAPVFVRGYVSQISKTLGLPEKQAIDSYMSIFKEKTKTL